MISKHHSWPNINARGWAWVRALGGALVLGGVVWWVGTGPFMAGLTIIDVPTVLLALGAGALATVCFTWRWRFVAASAGLVLPWQGALTAYYRSQFLNATLPTGVVGDVDRAVRHGARIVVWERGWGLAAQAGLAAVALLAFPPPVGAPWLRPLAGTVAVVAAVAVFALAPRRRAAAAGVGVVVAATGLALAGHLAVFVAAARAAGTTAPLATVLPLTLLALLAMVVPVNLAGWGPREGVAAWAFAAAGLGEAQGVRTAVAYGVLSLIGVLPGAAVLAWRAASRE